MDIFEKEGKFNVGDWVILDEEFKKKILAIDINNKDIYNHNFPQKIIKIKNKENKDKVPIYFLSSKNVIAMKKNSFRIATEKDFIKDKIKNVFIQND
jgi:hypothetical protein